MEAIKRKENLSVMQNFKSPKYPSLSVCVLGALELLNHKRLPKIKPNKKHRILVVGSGNALESGKMIFDDSDCEFRSESNYLEELDVVNFDSAYLISASGGKHAPGIATELKKRKIKTYLITNNPNAKASKFVDKTFVYPRQREPYTYNTSTYFSMIAGKTSEKIEKIYRNVRHVDKDLPELKKYKEFFFIIPSKFDSTKELFETKFDELFGPKIMGKVFTEEEIKHAKTVVPSKDLLYVSMGFENDKYGQKKNRYTLYVPKNAGYVEFLAIGYYFIGKIQEANPDYFGKNIDKYCRKASKLFGEKISPIVG